MTHRKSVELFLNQEADRNNLVKELKLFSYEHDMLMINLTDVADFQINMESTILIAKIGIAGGHVVFVVCDQKNNAKKQRELLKPFSDIGCYVVDEENKNKIEFKPLPDATDSNSVTNAVDPDSLPDFEDDDLDFSSLFSEELEALSLEIADESCLFKDELLSKTNNADSESVKKYLSDLTEQIK